MTEAIGVSNNVVAYLAKARERARQTSREIEGLSERVRSLAATSPADPDPREAELAVAIEELRTQNEDLANSCSMLERERARYLSLFANAPDAYLTTNAKGVIAEANAAAGKLLGMEPWFLAGKLLIAFVARQDVHAFRQHLQGVERLREGSSAFSLRMRTRGAPVFAASLSVRAIRADDGVVVGHLWLLGRTRADAALRTALEALAEVAELARERAVAGGRGGQTVSLVEVVASAVEQATSAANAPRVRFAPEGDGEPLRIRAEPERLRRAIDLTMKLAASSAPEAGELHVRLGLVGGEACLEIAAEGAGRLVGADAEILAIAAQIAADGGRLTLPDDAGAALMCRVMWPRG